MAIATIVDLHCTWSAPFYINVKYHHAGGVPPASEASELIILELPALGPEQFSRRLLTNEAPSAKAYGIDLCFFSVNCVSEEYDARLFTKDDIDSADTLYEAATYTAVSKSVNDIFERFPIRNCDVPHTNRLYVFIQNYGVVDTGPIDIELTYLCTQDQP